MRVSDMLAASSEGLAGINRSLLLAGLAAQQIFTDKYTPQLCIHVSNESVEEGIQSGMC